MRFASFILIIGLSVGANASEYADDAFYSDTQTGLLWLAGPDENMTWNDAAEWVSSLGGDWRLPSRSELSDLFNTGIDIRDAASFDNSGFVVTIWSGESDGNRAWSMNFFRGSAGGNEYHHMKTVSLDRRALAVCGL